MGSNRKMTINEYESYSKNKALTAQLGIAPTVSGVNLLSPYNKRAVSASEALQISAYYAGVMDKARTIGQLPLKLFRVDGKGKTEIKSGRLHKIFTQRPTPYMTMQQYLEMLVVYNESVGAFYAKLTMNDRGTPMEITPLINQRSAYEQYDHHGVPFITYVSNGSQPVATYNYESMFITKKTTADGINPISPIRAMAQTLSTASSEDEMAEQAQNSQITSRMGLATDQKITGVNTKQEIKDSFAKVYGAEGFKEIPIFDFGLKPVFFNLNPAETQLLESRAFTVDSICAMIGTMKYRVFNDLERPAKGVLPELDESFMRNYLNPELIRIEDAFNNIAPDGYSVEFDRRAYYAGSPWRLVEAVSKEISMGLSTLADGQRSLGREPNPELEGIMAVDTNNLTFGNAEDILKMSRSLTNENGAKPNGTEQN